MKRINLITVLLPITIIVSAQLSEGGLPPSYKAPGLKSSITVADYTLAALDTSELLSFNAQNPIPLRYAVLEQVTINIKSEGMKTVLDDGGTIWRYRINSPNGKSIQVIFSKYLIPDGAQLFLYNENYSIVRGAFTSSNIRDDLRFVTGDIPGNNVIVEYHEPASVAFSGEVSIGWIGQSYINIFEKTSRNADINGYIPVNCEEGKDLQEQKHSVCKITFNDSQYSYMCSGAFINNTRNDGTPYFLTANHCINTDLEATTVVAYFNYEDASCSVISYYTPQTLSGAVLSSTGYLSDYTLLRFNDPVPVSYKPYYAGWDLSDANPLHAASIHHPHGYSKKISVDYDQVVSYDKSITWQGGTTSPPNSHWLVVFDEGITSSGSSGAPLFDNNKRIRGQLHGGTTIDFYGRISYSWTNPSSSYSTLKSFLDPDNTNITVLDGWYPPGNLPDPRFISQFSSVCLDAPIELTGFSAFSPTEWEWSFVPSKVTYHNGTSAASQSPVVSFNMSTGYSVKLKAVNSSGSDILTVDNFILSGSTLYLQAFPSGMADSCVGSFSSVTLQAYGADAYQWTLSETADDYFYVVNSTANPAEVKLINGVDLKQSTDIDILLTGYQGACQNTLSIKIPLLAQTNDDIANAIQIKTGSNGPFSNKCATIQAGEPIPPFTSCTGQLSWCDEYLTGQNIVERSVWFWFIPDVNQTVSLSSQGFDNEIAVYAADSYQDILAGNYTLLGANDDYTDTDYNPRINSINVVAGNKYWVQVDGSGGGSTGTFHLTLSIVSSITEPGMNDEIRIYPQPAGDFVIIESDAFRGTSRIRAELFNSLGEAVCNQTLSNASGIIQLPLTGLPPGIYFVRLFLDDKTTIVRIAK